MLINLNFSEEVCYIKVKKLLFPLSVSLYGQAFCYVCICVCVSLLIKASSSGRWSGWDPLPCLVVHKPKVQRLKLAWRPDSEGVLDSRLSQDCSV